MSKNLNFEESLTRLEEITQKLENGELSLDDSLKFFEEGVKLSRFCEKKLTEVEHKIEILKNTGIPIENDDTEAENPFKNESSENDEIKTEKKKNKSKNNPKDEDNLLF